MAREESFNWLKKDGYKMEQFKVGCSNQQLDMFAGELFRLLEGEALSQNLSNAQDLLKDVDEDESIYTALAAATIEKYLAERRSETALWEAQIADYKRIKYFLFGSISSNEYWSILKAIVQATKSSDGLLEANLHIEFPVDSETLSRRVEVLVDKGAVERHFAANTRGWKLLASKAATYRFHILQTLEGIIFDNFASAHSA